MQIDWELPGDCDICPDGIPSREGEQKKNRNKDKERNERNCDADEGCRAMSKRGTQIVEPEREGVHDQETMISVTTAV